MDYYHFPRSLAAALITLVAMPGMSAGVFDASSRAALAERHIVTDLSRSDGDGSDRPAFYPLIATVTDESGIDELDAAGAVIFHQRDDMVLCCVPAENIDMIDRAPHIGSASLATSAIPLMDMARPAAGVDMMASGEGFDMAYDGSGVVAGFCDTGFDAGHIDFAGRTGMFSIYDETNASRLTLTSADEISGLRTDSPDQCHATHVAGIMAGGYTANGYQGVAGGATIAATTSALTDVGVLAGIEDIVGFAASRSMPAVVNISLGNYTGPHDGSTLFNRYLSLLGEEAVICISAGNNGNSRHSLSGTFSDENENSLRTSISTWDNFSPHGVVDIWSHDSSEISVELGIFDTDTGNWLLRTRPTGCGDRASWAMTDNPEAFADDSDRMIASYEAFNRLFDGYILVDGETDSRNGRHHVAMRFNYTTSEKSIDGEWARYRIALIVKGREGNRADIFTDGQSTMLRSITCNGFTDGDDTMSISDMACGHNIISVGMTVSRDKYPLADASDFITGYVPGMICSHSSYGTTPDGRRLPHISAPGWHVVSAYSGAYADAHGDVSAYPVCDISDGFLWTAMGGTSMSSPLVAGVAACWLQALPHLTVGDVTEALQATARHDMPDADNPRYGMSGAIDASAGLAYLLARHSSAGNIASDEISGDISVWNLAGVHVAKVSGPSAMPEGLPPGIYLLRGSTAGGTTICRKIVVR